MKRTGLIAFVCLIALASAAFAMPAGLQVRGGLFGGAGVAQVGCKLGVTPLTGFVGYGAGNNYNLVTAQLEMGFDVKLINLAASIDYAAYSNDVSNIMLLGNVSKSSMIGLGVTAIKELPFLNWQARLGYSTVYGLTAAAAYKF